MKKILKKSLICMLVITLIVCNLNVAFAAGDSWLEKLGSGLIGIFTWIIRAPFMALMMGIHGIVTALVKIGAGDIASYGGAAGLDDFFVTPYHIFFNKITILDVNFLNLDVTGTVLTFRTAVAGWYYTMRLIACMVLAVILIYIGIRMAISTIATEKAMYKKMIVDWTTSLALLFLLHYIMIFTFACNDALIKALEQAATQITATDQGGTMSTFMSNLTDIAMDFTPESLVLSFAAIAVYGIIVIQTLGFVLSYIKRMLTIGFLIIIAPLITITYSIDKIGDGKAQALNTWLKEFVYNILIQPFHCILFMSFAGVAMKLLQADMSAGDSSIATAVLAVLCIQYVKTGEELVKKIFGFGNASSLSSMAAGTAMAMTAMAKSKDAGKVVGGAVSKGKNLIANNKEFKALKSSVSNKAKDIKSSVKSSYAKHKNERINDKLDKKAEKEAQKKHGGHATQADIENMRKQLVAENAAKRERKVTPFISGVKNNAKQGVQRFSAKHTKIASVGRGLKNVASLPAGLARDAGKYMSKNSSKIISGAVGATLGVAGLANGGSGFYTGYQAGSGIVQGYMANTNKTLKQNLEGLAKAGSSLTDMDVSTLMYSTTTIGDNDGFKDLKKDLNNLLSQLSSKLNCKDETANKVALGNMQKMLNTDPASLNRDSIREIIRNDMGDTAANDDKVVDAFASHMAFEAQASLYKQISNARNTGRTVEDVIDIVGDIDTQTQVPQDIDIETRAEIDYNMLAKDIASYVHVASTTMSTMDTSKLNAEIAQLNAAINGLNSNDEIHKAQILSAIQKNDQQLANLGIDDVKTQLQQAMQERQRVVNSTSNTP